MFPAVTIMKCKNSLITFPLPQHLSFFRSLKPTPICFDPITEAQTVPKFPNKSLSFRQRRQQTSVYTGIRSAKYSSYIEPAWNRTWPSVTLSATSCACVALLSYRSSVVFVVDQMCARLARQA